MSFIRHPLAVVLCFVLDLGLTKLSVSAETPQQPSAQIDAILQAHWKENSLPVNPAISDETFLRRVFLDVAGRIPTVAEAQDFLGDQKANKRAILIDRLLASDTYTAAFYPFWADILRMIDHQPNTQGVSNAAYERYVKQSLRDNKPYDQFVRELLSAKGLAFENGAVGYYLRDRGMPLDNMAITSRIFLGTRIECAQCHDHPFDKWKQTDFHKLAAFTYGNLDRRFLERFQFNPALTQLKEAAASGAGWVLNLQFSSYYQVAGQWLESTEVYRTKKDIKLPHDFKEADGHPNEVVNPAPLFGSLSEEPLTEDRAEAFARWVTAPENPRFTKVIVNRLWRKLFGAPLTESYDQLTDESKSSLPELETFLEKLMVSEHYDMKAFLKALLNTRAYQSAAVREEYSQGSVPHFQGPYLRRMAPEQIWDSFVALVSYEPDAKNSEREALLQSKIRTAKTTHDAYFAMGVNGVINLGLARLDDDKRYTKERAHLLVKMEEAGRKGDQSEVESLKKAVFSLEAQWENDRTATVVMPLLENLAKKSGGQDARLALDDTFSVPQWDYLRATRAFTKFYIPGDLLAPKSKEQITDEHEYRKNGWLALAAKLRIPDRDRPSFEKHCQAAMNKWVRSTELSNPAPRGHFLRDMGQSDRELVENANMNAGISQALLLMNSEIASDKGLLAKFSPLMLHVSKAPDAEKLSAVCLALFSRAPTPDEKEVWRLAQRQGVSAVEDLVFALLNTPQFMFIE
jgi:hypothetical protein